MSTRTVRAIALAALLVLAGCGGGTTADQNTVNPELDDTPSATPTATPTPDYPPGVSADEVDQRDLALAHDRMFERRNASYRAERLVRAANGTVLYRSVARVQTAGHSFRADSRFITVTPSAVTPSAPDVRRWSNGTVDVRKSVGPAGNVSIYATDDPSEVSEPPTGRGLIVTMVSGVPLTVGNVTETPNGTVFTLRGTADEVASMAGFRQNVSVVLRVRADGLILSGETTFEQTRDGVSVVVTDRFRVTNTSGVTVTKPEWVSAALAESSNQTVAG